MILFDSQKRASVAVSGRALRLQQDIQRFLADSMYYFDLPASQLEDLLAEASESIQAAAPLVPSGKARQ